MINIKTLHNWSEITKALENQTNLFKEAGIDFHLYMEPELHYRQISNYSKENPIVLECRLMCFKPKASKLEMIKLYHKVIKWYGVSNEDIIVDIRRATRAILNELVIDLTHNKLNTIIYGGDTNTY